MDSSLHISMMCSLLTKHPDGFKLMILSDDVFSIEIGLELGGITRSVHCLWMSGSSAKIRNKKNWRRSPVAFLIPKLALSDEGEKYQLLRA